MFRRGIFESLVVFVVFVFEMCACALMRLFLTLQADCQLLIFVRFIFQLVNFCKGGIRAVAFVLIRILYDESVFEF